MADPEGMFAGGRGRILVFCWLGWVFEFCDLILFAFTKRAIAQELGLELWGAIAWIEGLTLLATALGGFLFGRLADRHGRRPAMVAGLLLFGIGSLATAAAGGFWSLLLARLLTGLGVGGEWGIAHAVVAEHWPERHRDRVHAILQAGSPVAMAIAAALGCFLAPQIGWRLVFVVAAVPALLAMIARQAMPGPARPAALAERLPARALFAAPHRQASVVLLVVLMLHMTGFWCVYAELPAALMALHEVPIAAVGWFQIQVNAVHVVADLAFGWLAVRYGRLLMFVLFCLVFAAGQALLVWQLANITRDFTAFTWAVALLGLGAGTWSCFGALFGTCYPAPLRATAAATFYASARGVQLVVKPALAGALAAGSFAPALWVGVVCALGSAVAIRWLPVRPGGASG
ncbi:MAG: MFS transporter [Planctomycetes bacterium]|nr:MFS transporter [Planctomycetota bacterium]